MTYVHCHHCDFSQDDFWNERYNPARWMLETEEWLLTKPLDELCPDDEGTPITWREWLAQEFERKAKTIREMRYRTHEEFKAMNPKQLCPRCGHPLDID